MSRECRERFSRHRYQRKPLVNDPEMHQARAVMHVGIGNPRWQGKRSRHSRRMHNPHFYVFGKRPMDDPQLEELSQAHRMHARVQQLAENEHKPTVLSTIGWKSISPYIAFCRKLIFF